jgi:hypothetical protein
MKKLFSFKNGFTFLVFFFVLSGITLAQPQYYNFQNVGTSSNSFPFNVAGGKAVQWLFQAGEFTQPSPAPGGNITRVYFFMTTAGTRTFTNLEIKMGQANITNLPASWYAGQMTTVYQSASVMYTSSALSWMSIELDTPFPYDPGMSLIIEVGQCGASGSGMSVRQNVLANMTRNYSVGGCPFVYSSQTANVLNCGVDISPGSCDYNWSSQTSGTTSALNSVKAVNSMIGWAAGVGATVRKTTDGGATWTNGNPNPGVITGDIYAIDALGADTAWCTTSPSATFIYRTINGGTNWTQVHTQTGGFFNAMKFINSSTGFVQGDPVGARWSLWKSTDGGATWDSSGMYLAQDGSEAGWNNSVFVEGNNIWFGTNNTRVYYSSNFGTGWLLGPTTGLVNSYNVHFNTTALGLAGGTTIVKTTDNGASYSTVGTVPGTGNILGIEGKGTDFWYVRGTGVYRSTNSGDNWASEHTAGGTLNDMDFADDGCLKGWAVGATGSISRLDGVVSGLGNGNITELPASFKLNQNYPNPFNPSTTISFEMPKADLVELKVFDMLGREVATLVSGLKQPGTYKVDFDASGLSSGVYIFRLKAGDFIASKKMTLLK